MPRAYISAKVNDELHIKNLRDQLWNITNADGLYRKKTPHITVVPPFTVKNGHEHYVKSLVEDCKLEDRPVKINTIGTYLNIHKPYVVLLYVDVTIKDVRNKLINELEEHTQGKIIQPVEPHITLFKTQGWWDSVDEKVKQRLQREILNRNSFKDTKIRDVNVEFEE